MAQPTDNPYAVKYNVPDHWTRYFKWTTVLDASQVSGLLNSGAVDSAVLANTMQQLSANGGGVLYFPAGIYTFNSSVELPSGIILRGETPAVTSALDTNFAPPTQFRFPHYVPTLSGNGTPNSTAFKTIGGVANAQNLGLVYLDIDGASIAIHPHSWQLENTRRGSTYNPVDVNANVLVFGIRSNNTATPDPATPSACQVNNGGGWQRWVWSFSANIDLFVSANGVVANCRMNDNPSMTFNQPGYFYGDGANCTPSTLCNNMATDGSHARFDVTAHYAVVVNRAKINKSGPGSGNFGTGPNGPWGIHAWITYGEPDTEPYLFVPGNEVRDCWLFKTNRIGIQAAGTGLKVLNNKILDRIGKEVWISPNGTRCNTNNAATFENRGIDISGWDVQVSYNNVMVEQAQIRDSPFPTVDGEGILVQECCGGSSVKDYVITHNLMQRGHTGYIGLWAMRDIYNTRIDSNDLNCEPIILWADYAGTPIYFKIQNSSIKGNTDVANIGARGTAGGANLIIDNNEGCNGAYVEAPCYATIGTGNTGMTVRTCTQAPILTLPSIQLNSTSPLRVPVGTAVNLDWSVLDADSVRMWRGARIELPYSSSSVTQLSPVLSTPGYVTFTVEGKNTVSNSFSNAVTFYVEDTTTLVGIPQALQYGGITLAPNPTTGSVKLSGYTADMPIMEVSVADIMGRRVSYTTATDLRSSQGILDTQDLHPGLYLVRITMKDGSHQVQRLVKE